jgi:hypothetical protein
LSTLQGGRGRSRRPTPIAGRAERRWALAGLGSRLSAMKARHGLWRRAATKDAGHAVAGAPGLWAHHSRPPGRLSVTAGWLDGSKHARHRCMRAPVSGLARGGAGQPAMRALAGYARQHGSVATSPPPARPLSSLSCAIGERRRKKKMKLGFLGSVVAHGFCS